MFYPIALIIMLFLVILCAVKTYQSLYQPVKTEFKIDDINPYKNVTSKNPYHTAEEPKADIWKSIDNYNWQFAQQQQQQQIVNRTNNVANQPQYQEWLSRMQQNMTATESQIRQQMLYQQQMQEYLLQIGFGIWPPGILK